MEEDMEIETGADDDRGELDFDYEFEAARYFELWRPETPEEAREAEMWFERARGYPPSPFMPKMNPVMEFIKDDGFLEDDIGTHPNLKDEFHTFDDRSHGITFTPNSQISETKCFDEEIFSRCSTLLRPTASQLAKQRKLHNTGSSDLHFHRLPKYSAAQKSSIKSQVDAASNGVQESKRQKLDGGHSQKVYQYRDQLEVNLLHKCPKKKNEAGSCLSEHSRLKLTIPQAPKLRTAKRADRMRSNETHVKHEQAATTTYTFKARPLNRKILEGPTLQLPHRTVPKAPEFQEFRLKTSQRAAQNAESQLLLGGNDFVNPAVHIDDLKVDELRSQPHANILKIQRSNGIHRELVNSPSNLKARPVNPKVLSNKEDQGATRCNKKENRKGVDFNFTTDKRKRPLPPTELFSTLTLEPGDPQNSKSTKFSRPFHSSIKCKGLKENMLYADKPGKGLE